MRFNPGLRFRFRLIPFIATLIIMSIGAALGQWQLRRADLKQAIEVKLGQRATAPAIGIDDVGADLENAEYRRLHLRGEFLADWPLYLDNRPYQSRAGLYVLMPLRLAGSGKVVMVERGWIARNPVDRARVPPLATPTGIVMVEGQVRRSAGHVMQLGEAAQLQPRAIVQNLDLNEFARTSRLPLQPFLVEQLGQADDGLVRDWPKPSVGVDRHLGYAFQWFALVAMAAVFFVVTGFRSGKPATE
ncbi:MAG: SURF1 family protein [Herminiimonas sp.]|nr:SURF1 family protein [Herminiimonas sp.]